MEDETRLLTRELVSRFSINKGYYLDKALRLLEQFQGGGIIFTTKRIRAVDLIGVSPEDIYFVMQNLNDTFAAPVIQRVDTYGTPYVDEKGAAKVGMDFIYESTPHLGIALPLLQVIKSQNDKLLILKDGVFEYRNVPLDINKDTHIYEQLEVIYSYLHGQSGEISYKNLCALLKKLKRYKNEDYDDDALIALIQKYLITKNYEFDQKLRKVWPDAKPLFKTLNKKGILFMNEW
jgi:hypothetical protein